MARTLSVVKWHTTDQLPSQPRACLTLYRGDCDADCCGQGTSGCCRAQATRNPAAAVAYLWVSVLRVKTLIVIARQYGTVTEHIGYHDGGHQSNFVGNLEGVGCLTTTMVVLRVFKLAPGGHGVCGCGRNRKTDARGIIPRPSRVEKWPCELSSQPKWTHSAACFSGISTVSRLHRSLASGQLVIQFAEHSGQPLRRPPAWLCQRRSKLGSSILRFTSLRSSTRTLQMAGGYCITGAVSSRRQRKDSELRARWFFDQR